MSIEVENWRDISRMLGYQVVSDIRESIVYLLGRRRHWVTGRLAMSYYPELEREDPDGAEISLRSSVIYSMVLSMAILWVMPVLGSWRGVYGAQSGLGVIGPTRI